jgi:hypothetical protein
MSEAPVPQDPGRDEDLPGAEWPEWMDEPGYLAAQCEDDPGDGELEEYEDPDNAPPPGMDDAQLAALIAEAREVTAEQAEAEAEMARAGQAGIRAAVGSVAAGRRGPGCRARRPGSRVSTPAGRRGSRRVGRWIPRRVARCWASSPMTRPGTMTGTGVPPMMSWSG